MKINSKDSMDNKEKPVGLLKEFTRFNQKPLTKANSSVVWFRFWLLVFSGLVVYINSKTVQDIPIVFSLNELGYKSSNVEKATLRTKDSGESIYNLVISTGKVENDEYAKMDITIYDFISKQVAKDFFDKQVNIYTESEMRIVNLDKEKLNSDESYSIYDLKKSPSDYQENTVFLINNKRVVVIKISNNLYLEENDFKALSNLMEVDI